MRQVSPYAAQLRRNATSVERTVWAAVRNRQIENFKFRRQHTIGPFIVDFVCIEARLIIELDGGQHSEEQDGDRTAFLNKQGYAVLRFWNNDVIENLGGVLEVIRLRLLERPSPNPLPQAGEG